MQKQSSLLTDRCLFSQSIGPEIEVIFKGQYWKEHPKFCVCHYTNYGESEHIEPYGPHYTFGPDQLCVGPVVLEKAEKANQ